jgi:SAM-dependent methyltransferase
MNDVYEYEGDELSLFSHALRWKRYFSSKLSPHILGDVLEVGAGSGGTTSFLVNSEVQSWTRLEPDPKLFEQLATMISINRSGFTPQEIPAHNVCGTLAMIDPSKRFDTIIYIDVLEHIEDDRSEIDTAARYLKPGGKIIGLCPAHNSLYSPFDRSIGHFRRYDRQLMTLATPSSVDLIKCFYLDSVGLIASLANKMFLRQSLPTLAQIRTWDRLMVPLSRVVDILTCYRLGKSIVGIWRLRQNTPQ